MLSDFEAFEVVPPEEAHADSEAVWISSRWEDRRKHSGELRCRWVLREFANKPSEGEFFVATPSKTAVEVVHVRAVECGYDLVDFDFPRTFLHAPEVEHVYTQPAEGYGDKSKAAWRMRRKVNGRRNGSQDFVEWFASMAESTLKMKRNPSSQACSRGAP